MQCDGRHGIPLRHYVTSMWHVISPGMAGQMQCIPLNEHFAFKHRQRSAQILFYRAEQSCLIL